LRNGSGCLIHALAEAVRSVAFRSAKGRPFAPRKATVLTSLCIRGDRQAAPMRSWCAPGLVDEPPYRSVITETGLDILRYI
jgi:hypothetical protein